MFFVILWKHVTGHGIETETEHSEVTFFVILWKHVMEIDNENLLHLYKQA